MNKSVVIFPLPNGTANLLLIATHIKCNVAQNTSNNVGISLQDLFLHLDICYDIKIMYKLKLRYPISMQINVNDMLIMLLLCGLFVQTPISKRGTER